MIADWKKLVARLTTMSIQSEPGISPPPAESPLFAAGSTRDENTRASTESRGMSLKLEAASGPEIRVGDAALTDGAALPSGVWGRDARASLMAEGAAALPVVAQQLRAAAFGMSHRPARLDLRSVLLECLSGVCSYRVPDATPAAAVRAGASGDRRASSSRRADATIESYRLLVDRLR
eukprot:SAG31_NODE_407_length_16049_cov_46.312915_19_plen_178_part_00